MSGVPAWKRGRNIGSVAPQESAVQIPEDFSFIGDARHCDDYIDDEAQPACLRAFLEFERRTALYQYEHPEERRTLYARTNSRVINFPPGTPVRLTMASRLGDVGISRDLGRTTGYEVRVTLCCLDGFSPTP